MEKRKRYKLSRANFDVAPGPNRIEPSARDAEVITMIYQDDTT